MYNDKNIPGTGGNSGDICFLPPVFCKSPSGSNQYFKNPKVLNCKMRNEQVFLLSPKRKHNRNFLHQKDMENDLVSLVPRAEKDL